VTVLSAPTVAADMPVTRRYPRLILRLFAVGTVLFVLAQVFAGLTLRTTTYPIVAFPMFAESPKVQVLGLIDVVTTDGVSHAATPADFGVTSDQLKFYIERNIANPDKTLHMNVPRKLQTLGELWSTRHGGASVGAVKLSFEEHSLDGSNKVTVEPVASWAASA
jgi:hypothetical protein